MTGFDSTWYHGPFAAGFLQSGDTWDLHFIAPQFLAWFYPANSEVFHAAGMLAFGRDVLSPLLNLGWFVGCLVACWCIGRPYRMAPWSLALGAIALSVPALADQAGEARNDIVGLFFLLAAVAIALNAPWHSERTSPRYAGTSAFGSYVVVGLAAGLAAGTKLNFLLPAAVLVAGLGLVAPGEPGCAPAPPLRSPPWPAVATGTCATSPKAATLCPGSTTSAQSIFQRLSRHWAAAKPTRSSATSPMAPSGPTGSSPASTVACGSSGPCCSLRLSPA